MKENPVPMKMGGEVGLKLGVAELVVGAVVDFAEKLIPDELKPKERPAQSDSLADLIKIASIRSELAAQTKGEKSKPPEQRMQESPALPAIPLKVNPVNLSA